MHKTLFVIIFSIVVGPLLGPAVFADDLESQMKEMKEQSAKLLKQLKEFQGQQGNKRGDKDPDSLPEIDSEQLEKAKMLVNQHLSEYRSRPYSDVRAEVKENLMNSKARPLVKKFPKIIDFIAHFYQDEKAMPSLMNATKDKDRALWMGGLMLSTLLIKYILGLVMFSANQGAFKRFVNGVMRFGIIWSLRIGILAYFYSDTLGPVARIVKKVFIDDLLA